MDYLAGRAEKAMKEEGGSTGGNDGSSKTAAQEVYS
jgi:hypothetical protein